MDSFSDNDFAAFKNNLIGKCTKEWIFQLDADEYLGFGLLNELHNLLEINDNVEMIHVPRINIVRGIMDSNIRQWKWSIQKIPGITHLDELELDGERYTFLKNHNLIEEEIYRNTDEDPVKVGINYHEPIVNFPDYQTRLFRNSKKIRWEGKVHEKITGYKISSHLPPEEDWSLVHIKSIERQVKQNQFYDTL